jgi:hypothetical protein
VEHAGGVVTRQGIERRLWPDGTSVDFEHSVNAAIRRLRAASRRRDRSVRRNSAAPLPYRFVGRPILAASTSGGRSRWRGRACGATVHWCGQRRTTASAPR